MASKEIADAIPRGLEEAYREVASTIGTISTLLVVSYEALEGEEKRLHGPYSHTFNKAQYHLSKVKTTYPRTGAGLPAFPDMEVKEVVITHRELVPIGANEADLVSANRDAQVVTTLTRSLDHIPGDDEYLIGINNSGAVAAPEMGIFDARFMGPGQQVMRDSGTFHDRLSPDELKVAFVGGLMDAVVIADTVAEAAGRSDLVEGLPRLYLGLVRLGMAEFGEDVVVPMRDFTQTWESSNRLADTGYHQI